MRSRREIISKLYDDTISGKIRWEITLDKAYVKAVHEMPVTKTKKVIFKLTYFVDSPKNSKLFINFSPKSNLILSVMDIGGKNKKKEVNGLERLLNQILLKEEEFNKSEEIDEWSEGGFSL